MSDMTAQQRFDAMYVTGRELASTLGVTRTTLQRGRERGVLADPVFINDKVIVWERATVHEKVQEWKLRLQQMRGQLE